MKNAPTLADLLAARLALIQELKRTPITASRFDQVLAELRQVQAELNTARAAVAAQPATR